MQWSLLPTGESVFNNKKLNDLVSKTRYLKYSHYLIMGNFNYPEIDWLKTNSEKSESDKMSTLKAVKDL
jgi:hypothetical protein